MNLEFRKENHGIMNEETEKLQTKIAEFAIEVLSMEETKTSPEMVVAISRLVGSKELFWWHKINWFTRFKKQHRRISNMNQIKFLELMQNVLDELKDSKSNELVSVSLSETLSKLNESYISYLTSLINNTK